MLVISFGLRKKETAWNFKATGKTLLASFILRNNEQSESYKLTLLVKRTKKETLKEQPFGINMLLITFKLRNKKQTKR